MERFTVTKMMDDIETFLQDVASASTTEKTGQLESFQTSG
jgi:hypothetical protein